MQESRKGFISNQLSAGQECVREGRRGCSPPGIQNPALSEREEIPGLTFLEDLCAERGLL